ncbi:MAG: hypothetical protein HYZ69_02655 [Candidatus Colwellbacteria bacterium]|nr:hypothetical protein [Candidatus Colwellbacteria bacterium]
MITVRSEEWSEGMLFTVKLPESMEGDGWALTKHGGITSMGYSKGSFVFVVKTEEACSFEEDICRLTEEGRE